MQDIIFYTTPQGNVNIEVFFEDETFWLTQRKMAELFGVEVATINHHRKEIFQSAELQEEGTIGKIRIVQQEGTREVAREVDHYNRDVIISVGYRVNSPDGSGPNQRRRRMKKRVINVKGTEITVAVKGDQDYISLTDMLRAKEGDVFIGDWLRNRNTVEFLGIWESVHNPDFNYGGSATIRSQAGLNRFRISVKDWVEQTNAIGHYPDALPAECTRPETPCRQPAPQGAAHQTQEAMSTATGAAILRHATIRIPGTVGPVVRILRIADDPYQHNDPRP